MRAIGQQRHLTFKANRGFGRHGWLRLTPAYSAHLVADLIALGGVKQRVLDPFCGTGTTPLLCAERGIPARAVDINPFLVWFASLKCTPVSPGKRAEFMKAADEAQVEAERAEPRDLWTPPIHDIEKWWSPGVLNTLARLWAAIRIAAPRPTTIVAGLLRVAFCRTLIECANVSFGHQSMSFRANAREDGSLFPESAEARVLSSFERASSELGASLDVAPIRRADVRVLHGDSRALGHVLPGEQFTTLVTSPPYPNRMSYIRELRPYMYWLGDLRDGREAGELDWKAIGGTWGCATSNLTTWTPDSRVEVPNTEFPKIVASIAETSTLLAKYVRKYFEDAVLHVHSVVPRLASGARVYYVVGNSKFYDVLLPTEVLYADILRAAGLRDVEVRTIRKRTSKKELFEFVVSGTAA